MSDKQQPEALRIADELEMPMADFPMPTVLEAEAAAELRRQHAELETLREKLKTYEDLGDAGSDVQLLRMGYAAARLEIESLKSQLAERAKEQADELAVAYMCGASREKELAAQQPGAAYAAQDSEHRMAIMQGERNASLDAYSRVAYLTGAESRLYEAGFTNGWDRRDRLASHGQAPADSVQEPLGPNLRDLKEALDIFNTARAGSDKPSGYLRGIRAVLTHWESRPSAESVQEDAIAVLRADLKAAAKEIAEEYAKDAARYQLVRSGQHWSVIDGIGEILRGKALDAAIDAVRAAQEGK